MKHGAGGAANVPAAATLGSRPVGNYTDLQTGLQCLTKYLFDEYGDFNAGAVAAALGLSEGTALRGADVAHVWDTPKKGQDPRPNPQDHGDDWIRAGYDWYVKYYLRHAR